MKKVIICLLLCLCCAPMLACKKTKSGINLSDYVIEERDNLFTANDDLYFATLSTGMREENYNFDGVVGDKVEFGVLSFMRIDSNPLADDKYTYQITCGEEVLTGFLEKSPVDNSYTIDLNKSIGAEGEIELVVGFTGYTFKAKMENVSNGFEIDKTKALEIADNQLCDNIKNLVSNKNNKIELVMKILKDNSSTEIKNYFWYVGVVSTSGETLGILINANTGDVVAKKV